MVNNRRVQKTKESLYEALSVLMDKKQYHKITVQDIIDEANVGRSTFYTHYETKDDLLFEKVEQYLSLLNNYIYSVFERTKAENTLLSIQDLFEHIGENKRAIRTLLNSESTEFFVQRTKQYWDEAILGYLQNKNPIGSTHDIPLDIMVHHISDTLISLLKYWLEKNVHYTPKEMNMYFQRLIGPLLV
ncbi:MAG: TetR/AcrR family transcriptional regulator [Mobilitalea sp.]